jgi:hypothetical protein
MKSQEQSQPQEIRPAPIARWLDRIPLWLLAAVLIGLVFLWVIANDADYRIIFKAVSKGVTVTIYVSVIAYAGQTRTARDIFVLRGDHPWATYACDSVLYRLRGRAFSGTNHQLDRRNTGQH